MNQHSIIFALELLKFKQEIISTDEIGNVFPPVTFMK